MLSPKQMLQTLQAVLAQVKASYTSENLLIEIKNMKKVSNNVMKSIKL